MKFKSIEMLHVLVFIILGLLLVANQCYAWNVSEGRRSPPRSTEVIAFSGESES